jgi:hypothetical protein
MRTPLSPRSLRTSSTHRATSCSHARFLRNAVAKQAAGAASFEARERIDSDTKPLSCPNHAYILALFTGHIASQTRVRTRLFAGDSGCVRVFGAFV